MGAPTGTVRCAAIVGPQGSGKTTLLKALIERAGGKAPALDASAEAEAFGMTTEPNIATCEFLGDQWSFIDCPGSAELFPASLAAMSAADIVRPGRRTHSRQGRKSWRLSALS